MTAETVVVTGANRGIGLEIGRLHAERGDRLIAGCRSPEAAEALQALGPAAILPLDVGDETYYFYCPGCRAAFASQQGA